MGNSRVDFVLEHADQSLTLVEVKNVVGADYLRGQVPAGRSKAGVYEVDNPDNLRCAIFPHGSHKPGIRVVSDRAIKHVDELRLLHGTVDEEGRKISSILLFIVNRSDCAAFRPCHEGEFLYLNMCHQSLLTFSL